MSFDRGIVRLVVPDNSAKPAGDSVERILAAAEDLFAAHGFDAVSVSDIASRASVSKSNVFHHFGSKNELYLAVLNDARQAFFELVDDLHDGHGQLQDRLEKFAGAHLQRMIDLGKISRLVLRDLLENSPARSQQLAEKIFGKNFAMLVETMRDNQKRGEVRSDIDPAMAAIALIAADVFFFQARNVLRHFSDVSFADDSARFSNMLVDILLHGILPRTDDPTTSQDNPI